MAGPSVSLKTVARALKIVALLLFLMPWATVSCSPDALDNSASGPMSGAPSTTIANATGVDLALGTVTLENAAPPRANAPAPPFSKPDILLIGAALLIALALVFTFVLKGATGSLAAIGALLLAGAASCYTMLVRVPAAVDAYFGALIASQGPGAPSVDPARLTQMVQVGVEPGFWQMIAALAAAIVLLLLAMPARTARVEAEEPAP